MLGDTPDPSESTHKNVPGALRRGCSYSVPIRLPHLYPPAKVRILSEPCKFSARKFRLRTLCLPSGWNIMEPTAAPPCASQTLIIYTIGNTRRRQHPTVITSMRSPDHSSQERVCSGSPGFGAEPHPAHMVAPISGTPARFLPENLQESGKRCIFVPENPTARPNGQECQSPERILRKAAHVTAYDQPRRGFFMPSTARP